MQKGICLPCARHKSLTMLVAAWSYRHHREWTAVFSSRKKIDFSKNDPQMWNLHVHDYTAAELCVQFQHPRASLSMAVLPGQPERSSAWCTLLMSAPAPTGPNGRAPLLFQIKRWLPCSPGGMKWHLFTRSRIGPSVRQCPCLPCQLTTQHLLPAWPTHTTFGGQRADQGRHLIPQAPWAVWKNFGGQQHSVIITNDWGREEAWNI